ncbi:hypothetical protein RFI_22182 [Reticulomyxa filosa]|uniref:Fascin domain-containing protein n=1 Tax=Reticulomyxa filosa TaxID=46433 RepID=X6MP11_RETFI|nr:hypothetical protein RFI_22182 [Reticulomyxa filosa]|eukprot:ETO15182.1 hypothetical protein RFI_22182 [Reticulomyxa filosa]
MSFENHYLFAQDNTVVIHSHKGGKFIRVHPDNHKKVDHGGVKGKKKQRRVSWEESGPLTIWHANKEGDKIAFKSDKGEGWLRITEDHKVDAAGVKGGPQTWFKVHKIKDGFYKFESVKHEGHYLAVRDDEVTTGSGGPFCEFELFREK